MTLERAYLLYYIFNITTTIENDKVVNHKQLVKQLKSEQKANKPSNMSKKSEQISQLNF